MRISAYTTVYNGLFWFSTIEQTIRSALEFADEVIIVDGGSTDGTLNLIADMNDDRIKVVFHPISKPDFLSSAERKNAGLEACRGDYCVLLDADEVIPEWYTYNIRDVIKRNPETIAFHFSTHHFYRSWNKIQTGTGWYQHKIYMIRNGLGIKHGPVKLDRDNFVFHDDEPIDNLLRDIVMANISVFHYGWCRPDHVLLMKKWKQEREWWGNHYWNNTKFPFTFDNPKNLEHYGGKHPKVMRDLIKETWRWLPEFGDDYKEMFT